MRFLDLFSGIGGFHQAMRRIFFDNAECVMASEINVGSIRKYGETYGIDSNHDICDAKTHLLIDELCLDEKLDLVCGGFPCQSFSHAGNQEGFFSSTKGTLYFQLSRVIKEQRPKYFLLENVRNLKSHDKGNTWKTIYNDLTNANYVVDYIVLSPNQVSDIPAIRDRIFILGYNKDFIDESKIVMFNGMKKEVFNTDIYLTDGSLDPRYFDVNDLNADLTQHQIDVLNMWDDFRNRILRSHKEMISPIWTQYFQDNLDIPYDTPEWKKKLINKSHSFYIDNKDTIDTWLEDYADLWRVMTNSNKKFEWNAGRETESIRDCIIQFRPSGVRVKKSNCMPTFVAINQTPIIGRYYRYIKPMEMSKLYGFRDILFDNNSESYKQIGNTVSVDVVEYILRHMFENGRDL